MKIKYLFYIGVATLALSGCNDVSWKEPRKQSMTKPSGIPQEIWKHMPINSIVTSPEV